MAETRRYCLCGGAATATSGNADMVQGISDMFDTVHAGDGHGPATAAQARAARRRNELLERAE